jgi:replication factor C subunit 2/4
MENLIFNITNKTVKQKKLKVKNKVRYLPWVEKYRPKKLDEIILDNLTRNKMENFLNNKEISNMIITGNPGTGKTTSILCLAKQIYNDEFKEKVIEFNASDNRGLETINNSIIFFCKKKINLDNNIPKLVILDEADNITKKAQNTLSNLMELYSSNTKFVLTCNDYNKLVEGVQTRCIILRYNYLSNDLIRKRLEYICKNEKIKYDKKSLDTILFISQGDIRSAINCLESTFFGYEKITDENIYKICEKPPHIQIENLISECLNGKLKYSVDELLKLKKDGYCNNDILLTFINVLKQYPIDEDLKIKMLESVSKAYMITNGGVDTDLQLLKCVCEFYKIKKNM